MSSTSSSTLTLRYGSKNNDESSNNQKDMSIKENDANADFEKKPRLGAKNLISRGNTIKNDAPREEREERSVENNVQFSNEDEDEILSADKTVNGEGASLELKSLKSKNAESLINVAKEHGLDNIGDFGRQDIIYHILKNFSEAHPENMIVGEGVLEVLPDGFGFLRSPETNYFPGSSSVQTFMHFAKSNQAFWA